MAYPFGDHRDTMIEFLCKIYRFLGRDCVELGINWPEGVRAMLMLIEEVGPPALGSPNEEQQYAAAVSGLQAFIDDPKCPATVEEIALVQAILDELNFPKK